MLASEHSVDNGNSRVSDNRPSSYFKLAFNHKIARDSLKITKLIDCVRKIIIICKTIPKKKCSLYN
jgi:hypothetical protein